MYNARYDVLAWNAAYGKLFPSMVVKPLSERNVLWCSFTAPPCCHPFVDRDCEVPRMVAELHSAFARHVGEPDWESFVSRLAHASTDFAALWARRDVLSTSRHVKRIRHAEVGEVSLAVTRLRLSVPETRLMVYTPTDALSRARMDVLLAIPNPRACCATCTTEVERPRADRAAVDQMS
jgi:transcription regulator MmyB-like protein